MPEAQITGLQAGKSGFNLRPLKQSLSDLDLTLTLTGS